MHHRTSRLAFSHSPAAGRAHCPSRRRRRRRRRRRCRRRRHHHRKPARFIWYKSPYKRALQFTRPSPWVTQAGSARRPHSVEAGRPKTRGEIYAHPKASSERCRFSSRALFWTRYRSRWYFAPPGVIPLFGARKWHWRAGFKFRANGHCGSSVCVCAFSAFRKIQKKRNGKNKKKGCL